MVVSANSKSKDRADIKIDDSGMRLSEYLWFYPKKNIMHGALYCMGEVRCTTPSGFATGQPKERGNLAEEGR
jgi:hypothetical protein